MKKLFKYGVYLSLILLIAVACEKEKGDDNETDTGTKTGKTEISISGSKFTPSEITIAKGTIVKWTNNDGFKHTVTDKKGSFDSGDMTDGATFEYTFNESGVFDYKCNYHSAMLGKITVE